MSANARRKVDKELLDMYCFARVVNMMSNGSTYVATRTEGEEKAKEIETSN